MLVRDGLKSQKSGFVGPHLTDCLRLRDIRPVADLTWLRPASSRPVTTADGQGEDATMPGLSGTSNLMRILLLHTAYRRPAARAMRRTVTRITDKTNKLNPGLFKTPLSKP